MDTINTNCLLYVCACGYVISEHKFIEVVVNLKNVRHNNLKLSIRNCTTIHAIHKHSNAFCNPVD